MNDNTERAADMQRGLLASLADRCEAAIGPDRELDRDIAIALHNLTECRHATERADGV